MPTLFEINGYRFFFYSNENNEPVHIHISKGGANCKFWLLPIIEEEYSYGFKLKERKEIKLLVKEHSREIIEKWNEFFR
jgi:hypothetical protein